MSDVRQIIARAPIASVNDDGDRMGSVAGRQTQLGELKFVRPVRDAPAGWGEALCRECFEPADVLIVSAKGKVNSTLRVVMKIDYPL